MSRDEAIEKLNSYASHSLGCDVYWKSYAVRFPECSCGLDKLRTALAKNTDSPPRT